MKLDQALGLHQTIEIWYVVDGYEAMLINDIRAFPALARGKGATIDEAMDNLKAMVATWTERPSE